MTFNQFCALILAFAAASQFSIAADEQKSPDASPGVVEKRDSSLGELAYLPKPAPASRPAQAAWR